LEMCLVRGGLVIACGAARFAIHEAVSAEPHIDNGLTEATIFFAKATAFRLLTLGAAKFGLTGCGAHGSNLALPPARQEMTLVIGRRHLPRAIHNVAIVGAL